MAFKKIIAALKPIIEVSDSRASAVFQWFIQALIILSLITFSMDTLPDEDKSDLHAWIIPALKILEIIIITVFSLEYILRIIVADNKSNYIFSFYGLVDFIAIIPFYMLQVLPIGADLRFVRAIRLFMILRILKIARYDTAIQRYLRAFSMIKEELLIFSLLALGFIFMSAVGIYYFEKGEQPEKFASIFHSLWWAVASLTPLAPDDVHPITSWGRVFASLMVLIGIGIIAVPTGLLASALSSVRREEAEKKKLLQKQQTP